MARLNDRTKGLWKAAMVRNGEGGHCYGVVDSNGCPVARVWDRDGRVDPKTQKEGCEYNGPTMQENAYLPTAAPQMYEALLAIHDSLMMRDALGSRPAKMMLAALKAAEDVSA